MTEVYRLKTVVGSVRYCEHYPALCALRTHSWGIAHIRTLLSSNLSLYILELWSILLYCNQFSWNFVSSQLESNSTSAKNTTKNQPNEITIRQPKTYMYLYGHNLETIAIKGNPVDQWSRKSFSELIHEYQVCKRASWLVGSEKQSTYSQKSVQRLHFYLLVE